MRKFSPSKILWLILGCLCLVVGTIGVFLPVLPTFPFYLVTFFSFAKSSQRLHDWFTGTKLYKKNFQPLVERKTMPLKAKLSILASVTIVMGFGFFMMARKGLLIPCIILAFIWIFHLGFFLFKVKTERPALTEKQITKKRKKEEYIVTQMIAIYCRKNHRDLYDRRTKKLCPECEQIAKYSVERSEHCPHIKEKTFCSNCTTHCYSPQMRDKIKKIMRFSGPRIILYHPVLAIWHLVCTIAQRNKRRKI